MSRYNKSLRRLFSKPKDFGWTELVALMNALGFDMRVTSGSHRKFIHRSNGAIHFVCEPHPSKELKPYQVKDLIAFFKAQGIHHESDPEIPRI